MSVSKARIQIKMKRVHKELLANDMDPEDLGRVPMFKELVSQHIQGLLSLPMLISNCQKINIMRGKR